jgi:hypothetical protein
MISVPTDSAPQAVSAAAARPVRQCGFNPADEHCGRRRVFRARRNIHVVAADVAALLDNVAQIDPDADLGCTGNPRPWQSSRHLALDLDDSAVMVLTLSSKLPKGIEEQTRKLFARHATSRILNQAVSLWRRSMGALQRWFRHLRDKGDGWPRSYRKYFATRRS